MAAITLDELTGLSAYVGEARRRWAFAEADLAALWAALTAPASAQTLPAAAGLSQPADPVEPELRKLRQVASSAVLWREVNGAATLEETGRALSRLAEVCLERALAVAEARVAERFGALEDSDGAPLRLSVLGMGKLGGDELNFNSDLDLIFAYAGDGVARGPRRLAAREYLTRVAQELVTLIDRVTEHGRVWAVDTRLRPFGSAGALVWPAGAIEQYYLTEGRTWERYALIKARPVAGDRVTGTRLLENLQPFVYRRYLDYGIFDQLRGIQTDIRREARRRGHADNIKLGRGGIRELEFIVQSLQLLRGGRHPALRARGFLPALEACHELALLPDEEAASLAADYRLLRVLENRLQAVTGRQTHALPAAAEARTHLARLMGAGDWSALEHSVAQCRARVHHAFIERFGAQPAADAGTWWPPAEDQSLERALADAGFAEPSDAARQLRAIAGRLGDKPLSAEGRRRLDALMPRLMQAVSDLPAPDTALADLLRLVETVARRSAYLSLLREQPGVLKRLVKVFADSHRVAEWIVASPQLLDDLLDPIHGYALADPPDLSRHDLEGALAALARYRQAGFLRTALGELDGRLDVAAARAQLSRLAQCIVEHALMLVTGRREAGLAVIAYGNLGADSMHYQSDLDLVFLHRAAAPPPLREAQRLINLLQAPTPGGRLYEIDTRLRPNGRAGLLVSTIDSFRQYQLKQAWTWEHQALIRARWIAGDGELRDTFGAIRQEVLGRRRDGAKTARDLYDMRRRQREERREDRLQRLRVDIQFVAELGVLTGAAETPELLQAHATDRLLERLGASGWLERQAADVLQEVWRAAGQWQHHAYLRRRPPPPLPESLLERCDEILKVALTYKVNHLS